MLDSNPCQSNRAKEHAQSTATNGDPVAREVVLEELQFPTRSSWEETSSETPPSKPHSHRGHFGAIDRIRNWFKMIATPPIDKPTGLESISNEQLVELCKIKRAFVNTQHGLYLTSSWAGMLRSEFLSSPASTHLRNYLKAHTMNKPLIELAVGQQFLDHRRIAKRKLQVSKYQAVDKHHSGTHKDFSHNDALLYLAAQESNSANIMSFGLLNEPLSVAFGRFATPVKDPIKASANHCEHEYLKRLAAHIARVIPEGGLLFGDGLHPILRFFEMDTYLVRSGLCHDKTGYKTLDNTRHDIGPRDPFFLKKVKSTAEQNPGLI